MSQTATPSSDDLREARARAAIARAQAQEAYWNAARSFVSSYGGGVPSRLDTPWPRGDLYVGEVRQQDYETLASLRDRACFLEKDNWLASGVLDRAVENVVGATIRMEPRTPNAEFNRRVKQLWKRWANSTACDVRGENTLGMMLRLMQRGKLREGEHGVLMTYRVDLDGRRLPKLQIIEPHRIESPPWARYSSLVGGRQITDGVELSPQGAPIAYWIRYTDAARQVQYRRVPARDFKLLKRKSRYSNVRGETAFQGGFTLFDQIAGVLEAVVVSWRVGASQAMIAKRKNPSAVLDSLRKVMVGNQDAGVMEKQRFYPVQAGGVNVIGLDEDLTPFNPAQPQQNFPEALRMFCRILGTRFGTTLEQVLLDFSQTTYSSGKMAMNQARFTAGIEQDDLAALVITPVYQWFISLMIEGGDLTVPSDVEDAWAHEWIPPARISPEPLKDMQARKMAIELGIDCRSNMAMEDGYDLGEIVEQNAKDRQMMKDKELPIFEDTIGGDAGAVTVNQDGTLSAKPAKSPQEGDSQPATLNGAQITAAIDVLAKSREGALSDEAATELLAQIGIERARASSIVKSLASLTSGTGDVAFKREVLKALLTVPQAREAVYNATDIEDLIAQTGLTPEVGYEAPYAAVVAPTGPLNSGAVILDPDGSVVGADIENDLEPEAPAQGGGKRNVDPSSVPAGDKGVEPSTDPAKSPQEGEGQEDQGQQDPADDA